MKWYLRVVAVCYFIGSVLHLADILDLRLKFSLMNTTWRVWIVYLAVFDFIAAIGLWNMKWWGLALFFIIAISQLVAYVGYVDVFGTYDFLVVFHLVTIGVYFIFLVMNKRKSKMNSLSQK
jgi:hypothetical protein